MKIAFGCQARVGKNIACDYLIRKYGGIEEKFAMPLYDILDYAQDVCGFDKEKDRKFLQFIGTDWGREKDPNIWANLLIKRLNNYNGNIFISDLRFKNEFNILRNNGFLLVRIIRNNAKVEICENHQSELDLVDINLNDWDGIIYNNGSIDDLYNSLEDLIKIWQQNDII